MFAALPPVVDFFTIVFFRSRPSDFDEDKAYAPSIYGGA